MNEKNFVNLSMAIMLNHWGYKNGRYNEMVYREQTVINPDVMEKYFPDEDCTDSDIYELTVEGGGDLQWNEVYVLDWVFDKKRYFGKEIDAPTLWEANSFVRNKFNIFAEAIPSKYVDGVQYYEIKVHDIHHQEVVISGTEFDNYDDAFKTAVYKTIKYIRNNETKDKTE